MRSSVFVLFAACATEPTADELRVREDICAFLAEESEDCGEDPARCLYVGCDPSANANDPACRLTQATRATADSVGRAMDLCDGPNTSFFMTDGICDDGDYDTGEPDPPYDFVVGCIAFGRR